MAFRDEQKDAIASEPHYHAWVLSSSPMKLYNGETLWQFGYTGIKQPHSDRTTARRHGIQVADRAYGSDGYMVRKCNGGLACPYLHDDFAKVHPLTEVWKRGEGGSPAVEAIHIPDDDDEASADLYGFVAR